MNRRSPFFLLLAALLGLSATVGLVGCGDPAGGAIVAQDSFEISMSLTYERDPGGTLPASYDGVLRVVDRAAGGIADGDQAEAWIGADGDVATFLLEQEGTHRVLRVGPGDPEALYLRIGSAPCGGYSSSFTEVDIELIDADGDGVADSITGTASGSVEVILGDVGDIIPFTATFSGALDETPPEVRFDGDTTTRHVLDGLTVRADEPLAAGTTAHIEGGGLDLDLEVADDDGVALFHAPSGTILPFGSTLNLTFAPSLSDLAGNLNGVEIARGVMTMGDPGRFAEDGFEGEVNGLIEGEGAQLVSGVGDLGTIEGDTSLFLDGAGRATFVIPIEAGDTVVRFRYQRYYRGSGGFGGYYGQIRVVSPGAEAAYVEIPIEGETTTPTGDGTWTEAGETLDMEIPIPAGATDHLFVDFRGWFGPGTCAGASGGAPLPEAALMVDELRAE